MWEYKGHCFPNGLTEAERYVKYDGLKDFFRKTYKLMAGIVQIPRPHIFCKDGFKMSVQAGDSLYCTPRTNLEGGEYETCEVGFPNQRGITDTVCRRPGNPDRNSIRICSGNIGGADY